MASGESAKNPVRSIKPTKTSAPRRLIEPSNFSTVFAGQTVGIKDVDEDIWLVSFMPYDLGYFDLEQKTLQPHDNPFGPRL